MPSTSALSDVCLVLGFGVVVAVTWHQASGVTPAGEEGAILGEAAGANLGETAGVTLGDGTPASGGGVPALGDDVPDHGDEAQPLVIDFPPPGDDAPGVGDGVSSSGRLSAFSCSTPRLCARRRSISLAVASSCVSLSPGHCRKRLSTPLEYALLAGRCCQGYSGCC